MDGVTLLDGGIGVELRARAPDADTGLLPVQILLDTPRTVVDVHRAYCAAGAKVITTNTYATVAGRMGDLAPRWAELLSLGGRLAVEARGAGAALIAGCLPPLGGSYRPGEVGAFDDILPAYQAHVEVLAPYSDVFLCETMSTAAEARAAAEAAAQSGKPVWVSWTIADDTSGLLRSGETLQEAFAALRGLDVEAVLVNCAAPEAITAAMAHLAKMGPRFGGMANGFSRIPPGWRLSDGVSALGKRRDLTPGAYADHVDGWIAAGASLVGGCCEVGPAHIAEIAQRLETAS
ncbi:MAG: homocysteine S-methyltransferase family protein [Pseudomonadota bacterium]